MAQQMVATSGNKNLRRNQTAELNARLPYLSNIVAAKNARRMREQDTAFRNKEFGLAEEGFALSEKEFAANQKNFDKNLKLQKKGAKQSAQQAKDSLAMQEKANKMGMGLEAGKLGVGLSQNLQANPTNMLQKTSVPAGVAGIGGFTAGQGITSGLAGFGASQFAGDNKLAKAGIGAGAGALMSLFTGGSDALSSAIGGGLFGGLGGLAGGLF